MARVVAMIPMAVGLAVTAPVLLAVRLAEWAGDKIWQ